MIWTKLSTIAAFAAELGNVQRVDVLPFHQLGKFKWDKLKIDYALKDTKPPSTRLAEEVVAIFRATGLTAY